MASVVTRLGKHTERSKGEGHGKTEADMGAIQLLARKH